MRRDLSLRGRPKSWAFRTAGSSREYPKDFEFFLDQVENQRGIPTVARPDRLHSRNVLHHEVARLQRTDQTHKMENEFIPRIIGRPLAHNAEALARRATEDHVQLPESAPATPCFQGLLRRAAQPASLNRGRISATIDDGKLKRCTAAATGSYSSAARTSKPACSKPRESPPAQKTGPVRVACDSMGSLCARKVRHAIGEGTDSIGILITRWRG